MLKLFQVTAECKPDILGCRQVKIDLESNLLHLIMNDLEIFRNILKQKIRSSSGFSVLVPSGGAYSN